MKRSSVFIIAEAGVNHNGNCNTAFEMVDAAVDAGADAVKFQTFETNALVTRNAVKAEYQSHAIGPDETQYEMLKKLELTAENYRDLMQYCKEKDIHFLSTAFDSNSLEFLVNELKIERLKVPSGELTNGPLLLRFAHSGRKLIVSTGMATLDEVKIALGILAFGFCQKRSIPSIAGFADAYRTELGQQSLKENVILLHCTSEYPATSESLNLHAISTMREEFQIPIGYSDHSEGIFASLAAVALGAVLIEKHFTLDRNFEGPDHAASLEPSELKELVRGIRFVESAMGSRKKQPTKGEIKNRDVVRKSIIASSTISKGERFTSNNIAIKRPGLGKSPMDYWDVLESFSGKKYSVDDYI